MFRSYPSLLSRDESTSIKGLLVLLVVLGHNSILMEETGLFPYLYSFHVYCFYILPFLYGFVQEKTSSGTLKVAVQRFCKNWSRFVIVYLFWCIVGIVVGVIFKRISFEPIYCIQAILWGHQTLLSDYCGFSFLWFLPTILSVMFWRDIYFMLQGKGKNILLICSLFLWLLAIAGIGESHSFGIWCPFALIQGLYFCLSGIVVRFIIEKLLNKKKIFSLYWLILVPLVPFYVYARRFLPEGCIYLTWSLCPIIAFLCFYTIKDRIKKFRLLLLAGKYSLQLYLLHTVIFNFLVFLFHGKGIFIGSVIYFLTLAICVIFICFSKKTKFTRCVLFPISKD